ncbi:2-polyprenyl-6-methoxyphenol hydroxylase-like FAD-dependent oxidoreductase [Catenulispora sp. MAP12-49]|uniref:FAD-dependent monooxygenase n=1 Tax=Catenulispora sp. MAP12-49 TaxID=3156302 RepID=UPI003518780C
MADVDVLVVGAGPVGLTAAIELARRGVRCRIIDKLAEPMMYAKAVGIQPRTLEVWDAMGVVREALDAAEPMLGQQVYVNGREVSTMTLTLPPDVPYGFAALPQYEVERILTERLAGLGVRVERDARLVSFEQDAERVEAVVARGTGEADEQIRARYLIGCDGAHSVVRKTLGLTFEGDAFPDSYMIGDVELDWSLPRGYVIRSMHQTGGKTDELLVCVPLPGHKRYRISMLAPTNPDGTGTSTSTDAHAHADADTAAGNGSADGVRHGMQQGRAPELADLQDVLDRLSPEPVTADHLRWSSVFRISHRLVDHYGRGRVFIAGDAAHIHPPTGGQGMNTGIQDAYNLAWKLALAVEGHAAEGLLDSYEAERLPVAEEVVGRTVRHARSGIESDPDDPATVVKREAQLLVGYPDSPIVGPSTTRPSDAGALSAQPGGRAPDCQKLHSAIATYPFRLFDLLRGTGHTLLLYADGAATSAGSIFPQIAALAKERADGQLETYAVVPDGAGPTADGAMPPVVRDSAGQFRAAYGATGMEAILLRPDGYVGTRVALTEDGALLDHLNRIFASA